MGATYTSKKLIGDEFIDDVIKYDDCKFIIANLTRGTYGHFVLLENTQHDSSLLNKLLSFFGNKPKLFKEVIYGQSRNVEQFGFYLPDHITFYDKYPKDHNENDTYTIICIDGKLELRHSLKGFSEIEDQPKAHEPVIDKLSILKMKESFKVLLSKVKDYNIKQETENSQKRELILSKINFQKSIKTFEELGYFTSKDIDTKALIEEVINDEFLFEDDIYKLARKNLNKFIYPKLSHTDNNGNYYTDKCILCDYEFLDPSEEYISFMERFGQITRGELRFANISLRVDSDGYENLDFTVNDVNKSWRLEKEGNILSEFFSYFAPLTKEFNTTGNYTYYSDEGQAFVVDYATEEEQELFIKKTRLKRIWLG